ncbi:MAG: lycopene beta-cyclase CrtY, partial [Alphaproteobacteria bacterium]|nr:lycopene beta-cyclase CrtY [Alphaproteobacteria bacterium]
RQANVELRLNTRVSEVTSDRVGCSDGTELTAACVIDGRGWEPNDTAHFALAYQKFFGLEIETDEPHGLDFPVIMDARVAQEDGYRFVYLLPYTDTAMLVEDTYYSDETTLDVARLSERVHAYVRHRGWSIKNVLARESGVLPIVLAGNVAAFHVADGMAPCSGVRAGLFHPLTGYSLPYAAGLAISIGRLPVLTSEAVRQLVRRQTDTLWRRHSFYRLLNRLLFAAASGAERRDVMQHFYRLPQALIERLYAGQSTSLDKFSVLVGRPPIPISRALKVVPEAAGWRYARGRRG